VASRFFKNFARWRLEKRNGIELATLEQIVGSQNLAGAVERLVFVRTKMLIGVGIVLTWGLSPLGGQSAVRLLGKGEAAIYNRSIVYYADPAQQHSFFEGAAGVEDSVGSVNTLYTSSLLASQAQKRSVVDLWGLPKIPQWPHNLETNGKRPISQDALATGEESYTSLLGLHIQGLDTESDTTRYNLTIETSYFDLDCKSPKTGLLLNESTKYFPEWLNLSAIFAHDLNIPPSSFAAYVWFPNLTETYPEMEDEPIPLVDIPPAHLIYASQDRSDSGPAYGFYSLFNCSIRPIVVETDIVCDYSSTALRHCWAARQRQVTRLYHSNSHRYRTTILYISSPWLRNLLSQWRIVDGKRDPFVMSSTDNYLAGERYPFTPKKTSNWAKVPVRDFSRRLTTAFNTYLEASLNPFNHTNVSFQNRPTEERLNSSLTFQGFMNHTEAMATTRYAVYRVKHQWVIVLIITTICLQILAIAGLFLQGLICGPDILGFASSLTRENPYIGLPYGGSGLNGPARTKALGNLRVHLSDVNPKNEVGYIVFKTVPSSERPISNGGNGDWRGLSRKRLYF
jgi:hypothetical protein